VKLAGKKEAAAFASSLCYSKEGLLPVVVASEAAGKPIMLAYANMEAVQKTLDSGDAWFFSRSRGVLWKKGETSGNAMRVLSVEADCDSDALLYVVDVQGGGNACHMGRKSCFVQAFGKKESRFPLASLDAIIAGRISENARGSYTAKLAKSRKLAVAKLREEAEELAEALEKKGRREIVWEACDLLYHALVAVRARKISLADLERELGSRRR